MPIIDLHCDLLGCIAYSEGKYNFCSPELNCSIPQLKTGNVKLQVLAIAAITSAGCKDLGLYQVDLYKKLLKDFPDEVGPFKSFSLGSKKIHFLFGIENASTFCEEDESIDCFFERFEQASLLEKVLYVSLTWNQENRFGGGNLTSTGLKRDGELVLEFLDGKNTAIDLSHTSDALAYDILAYVSKKGLNVPIIASHSNYRAVHSCNRNLLDEIAKEIINQKGLIGLNFVHRFVGKDPLSFRDHIQHVVEMGGENSICFGADFYGGLSLDNSLCPGKTPQTFFENFDDSSCYQRLLEQLNLNENLSEKLAYQNVMSFLKNSGFSS